MPLAQQIGTADFLSALELAAEQQLLGVEYVTAIALGPAAGHLPSAKAALPKPNAGKGPAQPPPPLELQLGEATMPSQREIERDLTHYEDYVANRQQLQGLEPGKVGLNQNNPAAKLPATLVWWSEPEGYWHD